jgi:hypothetical protein
MQIYSTLFESCSSFFIYLPVATQIESRCALPSCQELIISPTFVHFLNSSLYYLFPLPIKSRIHLLKDVVFGIMKHCMIYDVITEASKTFVSFFNGHLM